MSEKDEHVQKLEKKIDNQKDDFDRLIRENHVTFDRQLDELEQYGRRTSLRFDGVDIAAGETNVSLERAVKAEILKECGIPVQQDDINRLHRVGPRFQDKGAGKVRQQVIVRFRSFKVRQRIYEARPRRKPNQPPPSHLRVSLDLTSRRFKLL